ncbi:DUF2339 domain-containing protein [Paenibacillus allorhizosphaerae]|uniref:DUF2339 domain-containing protein n=1 Tax=Paenibacillus allorhizosphaerae TaxID=2849866 RepID=A0ABM8VT21_9BACL|nr:DUF2339 domain-containing protein [Paenibacillus allorhizosphaerae]CAG7657339.1 hypothetical protein PAECIP111802_06698 [Paenibacillus allorhizosphaerae]
MNEFLRKSWISVLGALFILCAFAYLFKYTLMQGWMTDTIKIGLGLAVGAGCAIGGLKLLGKQRMAGEIAAGLGTAILYTTFSYSGIYFALWDSMTVFLCMLALTIGMIVLSYKLRLRLVMNMALLGGLMSPMILRPETDQVFTLFLYLLVLNCTYFTVSIRVAWTELKLICFAGTWLLYWIYFIQMNPLIDRVWSLPFRYALAAYVFYMLAFFFSSWKNNLKFDGLNLYLGFVNAVLFGLWAVILLEGQASFAYPLMLMGVVYVALAFAVGRLTVSISGPVMSKLFGGILLILVASTQFGKGLAVKPLLNVYFWLAVSIILLAVGAWKRWELLRGAAMIIWIVVGIYWFYTTWDTPWGIWFGVYIPFLNWAALAWELLAAVGFYISLAGKFGQLRESDNRSMACVFSVLSHLVVGGLLTVQAENMITYYELGRIMDLNLTLSVAWGLYALLLFLWGAYSRQTMYRAFGSFVLVGVAVKTLLFDLYGSETIYKVIVLFLLGIITFGIAYINGKWAAKNPQTEATPPDHDKSGETDLTPTNTK